MANMDRSNKSYWISTALPSCIDDMIPETLEEQKLRFKQELLGVPQIKINTENFNIDYFKEPWVICDNYIRPFSMVKLEKETNKMEAKKCDRCGKLYEKPTADENGNGAEVRFKYKYIRNADDMSEKAIAYEQTRNIFVKCYCGDEVDFCPDCRESFKKWWESDDKK